MTFDDLKNLYDTNSDFKIYVDKFRKNSGRSVEETLQLKVIQNKALDINGLLHLGSFDRYERSENKTSSGN